MLSLVASSWGNEIKLIKIRFKKEYVFNLDNAFKNMEYLTNKFSLICVTSYHNHLMNSLIIEKVAKLKANIFLKQKLYNIKKVQPQVISRYTGNWGGEGREDKVNKLKSLIIYWIVKNAISFLMVFILECWLKKVWKYLSGKKSVGNK